MYLLTDKFYIMAKLRYVYSPMEGGKSALLIMEANNFEKRNIGFLCMKPSIEKAMIKYIQDQVLKKNVLQFIQTITFIRLQRK